MMRCGGSTDLRALMPLANSSRVSHISAYQTHYQADTACPRPHAGFQSDVGSANRSHRQPVGLVGTVAELHSTQHRLRLRANLFRQRRPRFVADLG